MPVMSTWWTRNFSPRLGSSSGFLAYPALVRFRSSKAAVLTMRMPPGLRSARCTLSAAGFMATSASSWSPGVYTRWLPNWSWKLDTPNSVPAGARISAGKFGNVEISLPAQAASVVNCSPVTCMPSPESPANRITARVSVRRGFAAAGTGAIVSLMSSVLSSFRASHTRPILGRRQAFPVPRVRISLTQDGVTPRRLPARGSPSTVSEPLSMLSKGQQFGKVIRGLTVGPPRPPPLIGRGRAQAPRRAS
jgi:hypothetical protein